MAREAVAIAEPTDYLEMKADALVALATVLESEHKVEEARDARTRALAFYEQKGITVRVAELQAQLG